MKKNFMKALVDKFYVDINETQIGIILSRGPAEIPLPADLPFGRTESSDAVKEFLNNLQDVRGASSINNGLVRALTAMSDGRSYVKQVV